MQQVAASKWEGSSPRMRGARTVTARRQSHVRIIPAYAGSTDCDCMPSIARQDHPRVCGEHIIGFLIFLGIMESSPRMRGAPRLLYDHV